MSCKFSHDPNQPAKSGVGAGTGGDTPQQPKVELQGPYLSPEGKYYWYNPKTMSCEWVKNESTESAQPANPAVPAMFDAAQLVAMPTDASQLAGIAAQPMYPQIQIGYPAVQLGHLA